MTDKVIELVCPKCKTTLAPANGSLDCPGCMEHYEVREGIPSFAASDFYWNEVPREQMQEVIQAARTKGWQTAIYDVLEPKGTQVRATIGDERRADWRYLLSLTEESRVLDLGCGWGAAAFALSEMCGQVIAMDATWERVQFLDIRRRQLGLTNLYPIHGGDELTFPFPDGYFDAVALVGVLEWLGESHPELSPREAQIAALRQIRRLLRPGGQIYIAIENRLGYDYLMGRPDHNGLPYIGLLPRGLADWVSRRRTAEPFRTYQYSMWGYRRLLQTAGFGDVQFYGDLPQYRHPHFYIPLRHGEAFNYLLTNLWEWFVGGTTERANDYRRAYRLAGGLLRIGRRFRLAPLARYIVPGFSIIAEKG